VEDAPYHLPNDEPEQVRLNQIQYSIRTTLGTNIIAPIPSNPSFILDIGAGSGIPLSLSYLKRYNRKLTFLRSLGSRSCGRVSRNAGHRTRPLTSPSSI
jgi:hypothetical protein